MTQLRRTYAQRIKDKTRGPRKTAPRPAAKPRAPEAAKAKAAASPPAAAPADPNALQQLKDDLQQINREISKIARDSRGGPDAGRHSQLPEKQELLARRQELERKIRTLSTR